MPRRIHLEPHLTEEELHSRYRQACDPADRSHWHFLWLLAGGMTATAVAAVTGYSAYWIGQIARRYNTGGPDSVRDRRHATCAGRPDLSATQRAELERLWANPIPRAIAGADARWPPGSVPVSDVACAGRPAGPIYGGSAPAGASPARVMSVPTRRPRPSSSPAYVRSCGRWRPRTHAHASSCGPWTNIALGSSPSSAKSGHSARAGLSRPSNTALRGAILLGFVHPASGRTIFHLATTVSIPLFAVELAAFARAVGAGPTKQIVLVLDRAGWHKSARLRVPEHVHLLFLPPYSPELQPAEHLWPLTNTVLVNQHFASIDELEDVQAERCVTLQARELAHPLHHTVPLVAAAHQEWPQRIKKRQGPRQN